jgi:hypothetical protein
MQSCQLCVTFFAILPDFFPGNKIKKLPPNHAQIHNFFDMG